MQDVLPNFTPAVGMLVIYLLIPLLIFEPQQLGALALKGIKLRSGMLVTIMVNQMTGRPFNLTSAFQQKREGKER